MVRARVASHRSESRPFDANRASARVKTGAKTAHTHRRPPTVIPRPGPGKEPHLEASRGVVVSSGCGGSYSSNGNKSTTEEAGKLAEARPLAREIKLEKCYNYDGPHISHSGELPKVGVPEESIEVGKITPVAPRPGAGIDGDHCEIGVQPNRSAATCAHSGAARRASRAAEGLDYKFGQRLGGQASGSSNTSATSIWARRQQAARRGLRPNKLSWLNKRHSFVGPEQGRDEAGCELWRPRSARHSCGTRRAGTLAASIADNAPILNQSSIKIATTTTTTTTTLTTTTNQWIGEQWRSDRASGLSSSTTTIRDRRRLSSEQQHRQQQQQQPQQPQSCYDERFALKRERFFSYSSLSIPSASLARRPPWHKAQAQLANASPLVTPAIASSQATREHQKGHHPEGSDERRRKWTRRRVQRKQIKCRPGGGRGGGSYARADCHHPHRANYHCANPIERHRTNRDNSSSHNKCKGNNISGEPATDCLLTKARRQQVPHTQQSRQTSHKGETVAISAAHNSQRARKLRQRIVVASLKLGGANRRLHEAGCGTQSHQATPTATTKAHHQSTRSDSLPECHRGDHHAIGAFGSPLLNVPLRSSSTSTSPAAGTAGGGALIKATGPALAKRSSAGKITTTTADISEQPQVSFTLHNERQQQQQQQQQGLMVVRLPFELAHPPALSKQQQRQPPQQHSRQSNCFHMTRGELGAPTKAISSTGQDCRELTSSDHPIASTTRQYINNGASNPKSNPGMETLGEKKTVRSRMAPEQQRAGGGNGGNRSNRAYNPAKVPSGPTSARPNRLPLLETPPSPLTMQIMRQNKVPYSNDKRPTASTSNQSSFQHPNNYYQHHRTIASSKQAQTTPSGPPNKPAPQERPTPSTGKKHNNHSSSKRATNLNSGAASTRASGGAQSNSSSSSNGRQSQKAPSVSAAFPSTSEQLEWEQQAPSTNIHSLEVMSHEARMAISIYDPLPPAQQPPSNLETVQPPERKSVRSPMPVVRPSELSLIEVTNPNVPLERHRFRQKSSRRGRGRTSSERVLKSPTIPEEEDESVETRAEPVRPAVDGLSPNENDTGQLPPNESFMVATIADETGHHSRTLVIYSDRNLQDLTSDVLKKLVEIELDRRRDEQPTDSDGEANSCTSEEDDRRRLELEIEADKLARLFRRHFEGAARSPMSPCQASPFAGPRFDPTAMSTDERARFGGQPNREWAKCRCPTGPTTIGPEMNGASPLEEPQASDSDTNNQPQQQHHHHQDIFDFRCSCCCLHLVNQQRREGGEHWCCCGCS